LDIAVEKIYFLQREHLQMSLLKEFKEFAIKGNVIDMAVGVIIGAAFGKVVTSVVSDMIMPPIGLLIGGVNFSNLAITLQAATAESPAVVIAYGKFIQTTIDFTIFMMIKAINSLKRQEAAVPPEAPSPTPEEILLTEIRDLLKKE
jgi:large conductance mechanosensitive channel